MAPELMTAAERLLKLERESGTRGNGKLVAGSVTGRFRRGLSTLMGAAGYHALLSRALTLAKSEAPSLASVSMHTDGSLESLGVGGSDGDAGEAVVVAHLLRLLVTFLGEALMLRLVQDMWPKARLDDLDFHEGNTGD